MANDITKRPWIIDTPSATAIFSGKLWIERMLWHEPDDSDSIEVTDTSGLSLWSKYALAGGDGIDYDSPEICLPVDGLIVPTMGSGTLYVWVK
jgi:hypothetical protein